METITFWVIYFVGIISAFLLGAWSTHKPNKDIRWNSETVCLDGRHQFQANGTPNGTMICRRCKIMEKDLNKEFINPKE